MSEISTQLLAFNNLTNYLKFILEQQAILPLCSKIHNKNIQSPKTFQSSSEQTISFLTFLQLFL